MIHRRRILKWGTMGFSSMIITPKIFSSPKKIMIGKKPLVISTWDAGINANKGAWKILREKGRALDAVEAGVGLRAAAEDVQAADLDSAGVEDRDAVATAAGEDRGPPAAVAADADR